MKDDLNEIVTLRLARKDMNLLFTILHNDSENFESLTRRNIAEEISEGDNDPDTTRGFAYRESVERIKKSEAYGEFVQNIRKFLPPQGEAR